ncbi:MAG: AAA family ATPase, partial [Dermatophilaceae bacterium]
MSTTQRFDELGAAFQRVGGYPEHMTELIGRHVEPVAREMLDHFPGVVIEGARQVGKSTLARQLVSAEDSLYVTLDDDGVRDAAVA